MTEPTERSLLLLWGFMGTGKSTLGTRLAERVGVPFVDLDERIERVAGKSVQRIFSEDGEVAFREKERAELDRVLEEIACGVVSLGGGALVDDDSRARALGHAYVVTLTADVDTIRLRTKDSNRPLLAHTDAAKRIEAMLARRAHAYAATHAQLATNEGTVDELTNALAAMWRGRFRCS